MARQRGAVVEDEVGLWVEAQFRQALGAHHALGPDGLFQRLGAVGVQRFRHQPAEAEDHRAVGGMALAGEGERAVQRSTQPRQFPGAGDLLGPAAQVV